MCEGKDEVAEADVVLLDVSRSKGDRENMEQSREEGGDKPQSEEVQA